MRMLLLHLARGYSLHETVVRAKAAGVANLSAVALFKRLRKAEGWLKELCCALLPLTGLVLPTDPKARRLRLVDSTTVKEPGKTGSLWRIQYSFQVPEFYCDYFGLSAAEGVGTGDSFTQFPITRGDHLMGDRGYSHMRGVEHIAVHGGYVLVRLNPLSLPLFTPSGRRFPLLGRIATLLAAGQVGEWPVVVQSPKRLVPGRLCAVRKSEAAIKLAEKRLKQTASRKGREPRPETWEYVKYILVFTTFSPRRFTASDILQWYRVRWQVELVFKRLKSLAHLSHLPKSDAQSARAWLYGKLFVVLLTEQLMRQGRTLAPWTAQRRAARAAAPLARICVCLPSTPASRGPRLVLTRGYGELEHHHPSTLRMPPPTATTARAIPLYVKLTLMGHVGGTAKDNRLFVEAVLYRYRAGLPWRDLPERFGDFRVIHTRHMRWSKSGVWRRIFDQLAEEADNEYAMIDSTIVRAHQHAAGAKGGTKARNASAARRAE